MTSADALWVPGVLPERKANLWLLSERDRKHGSRVVRDTEGNWRPEHGATAHASAPCASCGKPFQGERATATYCSDACRKRAQRRVGHAKNPHPSAGRGRAENGARSPVNTEGPVVLSGTRQEKS